MSDMEAPEDFDAIETPPQQEQAPVPPAWAPEDEEEAKLFGWKPPTEWQGEKTPGYIDNPQDYLARVRKSRTFAAMQERLDAQAKQAEEQSRKLAALNDAALKRQRDEYEARLASISAAQRKAVETADADAYDHLERQRAEMMRRPPEAAPEQSAPAPRVDPDVESYRKANEWTQNPLIWQEATMAVDFALRSGVPLASTKDQIDFAERAIRQKYPHMFQAKAEAPRPTRPAAVDGGGIASGRSASPFNSLPPEAKATFARFVRDGIFKDDEAGRAQYYEDYSNA